MSSVTTTSTLLFSVDDDNAFKCTVDGLTPGDEYDCRSQFVPDAPGPRPSYTTNTVVDNAGVADWNAANPTAAAETRPGVYHTKLVAPGTAGPILDGPDGEPLTWAIGVNR